MAEDNEILLTVEDLRRFAETAGFTTEEEMYCAMDLNKRGLWNGSRRFWCQDFSDEIRQDLEDRVVAVVGGEIVGVYATFAEAFGAEGGHGRAGTFLLPLRYQSAGDAAAKYRSGLDLIVVLFRDPDGSEGKEHDEFAEGVRECHRELLSGKKVVLSLCDKT